MVLGKISRMLSPPYTGFHRKLQVLAQRQQWYIQPQCCEMSGQETSYPMSEMNKKKSKSCAKHDWEAVLGGLSPAPVTNVTLVTSFPHHFSLVCFPVQVGIQFGHKKRWNYTNRQWFLGLPGFWKKTLSPTDGWFIQCPGKQGPDPWKDLSILQKIKNSIKLCWKQVSESENVVSKLQVIFCLSGFACIHKTSLFHGRCRLKKKKEILNPQNAERCSLFNERRRQFLWG